MNDPTRNLLIQGVSIVSRYLMQMLLFRKLAFTDIGELNIYLTFMTFSTILAGMEFHYLANREIALTDSKTINAVGFRLAAAAALTISGCLLYLHSNGLLKWSHVAIVLLVTAFSEYINLELSRLLVVSGNYISASMFGTVRAIAPYLAFMLEQPTVADCLSSMLLISLICIVYQMHILKKKTAVRFQLSGFERSRLAGLWPFFITGTMTSGAAFIERYAIKDTMGTEDLGRYAVVFIFVTANDTIVNGLFFQPYYSNILKKLSSNAHRTEMLGKIFMVTLLSSAFVYTGAIFFGSFLYDFLNKENPPGSYVLCVILMSFSKTLWSSLYYLYYANRAERQFTRHQIFFSTATVLGFYLTLKSLQNIQSGFLTIALIGFCMYIYALMQFKKNLPAL